MATVVASIWFFTSGAIVSCALLAGQIGLLLAGHIGLAIGETAGAMLAMPLCWITGSLFFVDQGWTTRTTLVLVLAGNGTDSKSFWTRHPIGRAVGALIFYLALANGGVLWLQLGGR
jgi:hypothetical protein